MITAEDLELADTHVKRLGRSLGPDTPMGEVHATLCVDTGLDTEAAANYVKALTLSLDRFFPMDNNGKTMVSTMIFHALYVGVATARIDEGRREL